MSRDDYLEHHGVKGQRWGIRNGPPYPLKPASHSKWERQANWQSSLKKSNRLGSEEWGSSGSGRARNYETAQEKHRDRVEAALKTLGNVAIAGVPAITAAAIAAKRTPIGAKAFIPAAAAIGLTAATPLAKHAMASVKEKSAERRLANSPVDKKTGLHIKQKETSYMDDAKKVNPGFKNVYSETKNNCTMCTTAYDMRRRGYDVIAQKSPTGYEPENSIEKWYRGAKETRINIRGGAKNAIQAHMSKEPDGSRGAFMLYDTSGGGHVMAYEKQNGKTRLVDAQCGKEYGLSRIETYANAGILDSVGYYRLDNLEPNYAAMRKVAVR